MTQELGGGDHEARLRSPLAHEQRAVATINVDLDPVDVHLRGYGHLPLNPDRLVHDRALPRLLELFALHGVRATFFILARDDPREMDRLSAILSAGHEIASHGVNHPPALATQPTDMIRAELEGSRRRLESVLGHPIVGFRSPDWSLSSRLVPLLSEAGYRYDASLMPTPFLLAGRLLLATRARQPRDILALRPPPKLRRRPYVWTADGASIVEFPLAVSPRLLLPIYHTIRPALGETAFLGHLEGFVRRGDPFSYAIHGVDALGLSEDGVDARLGVHPGMRSSLRAKLELLDRTVAAIVARFTVLTFAERLDGQLAPDSREPPVSSR